MLIWTLFQTGRKYIGDTGKYLVVPRATFVNIGQTIIDNKEKKLQQGLTAPLIE